MRGLKQKGTVLKAASPSVLPPSLFHLHFFLSLCVTSSFCLFVSLSSLPSLPVPSGEGTEGSTG